MSIMKMFSKGEKTFNHDVIRALQSQKAGELLPDDGVFAFLYEKLDGPSIPLMVCTAKETEYIYIDNEEFISHIKGVEPEWVFGTDKNLARLMMLYKINDSQLLISFVFDLVNEISRNAIGLLVRKKEFNISYLNMLYGGLVFENRVKYKLPEKIISELKAL